MISDEVKENIKKENIDGVCISTESEEFGIYKGFNYKIFERRNSVVFAFDEIHQFQIQFKKQKTEKRKAKIYVNEENSNLKQKARSLEGYVIPFKMRKYC